MTIPFKKLKDEWMKDPAFRAEHKGLKPEFDVIKTRVEAATAKIDATKSNRS